jgi:hypothetical protein
VAAEAGPGKGTRVEVRWPAGAPPAEPA